jgi:hypothetical protein
VRLLINHIPLGNPDVGYFQQLAKALYASVAERQTQRTQRGSIFGKPSMSKQSNSVKPYPLIWQYRAKLTNSIVRRCRDLMVAT